MDHSEKAKRKETPRRKNRGCIIAFGVLFCVGLLGCFALLWATANYPDCAAMPFPFYTDIEKNAYFELPPSAHNLEHSSEVASRSCTIWIKFEIKAVDFEGFQDSTLLEVIEANQIANHPTFLSYLQKKGWTQPDASIIGYGANHAYANDVYVTQWLLVDTTDINNFIVYLIVHKDWL